MTAPLPWDQHLAAVSRREARGVFLAAALLVCLALLPQLMGEWSQTPDQLFLGSALDSLAADTNAMWLVQAARGDWPLANLFTSQPHPGQFASPFAWLFALPLRAGWLSLGGTLLLAQAVSGLALALAAYGLVAVFFLPGLRRWGAWLAVLLSGGLGWLFLVHWLPWPGGISPVDTWLWGIFPWGDLLARPDLGLALALALAGLRFLILGLLIDGSRLTLTGAAALALASCQDPYLVLALLPVPAVAVVLWYIWDRHLVWAWAKQIGLFWLVTAPVVYYNHHIFLTNPGLRAWLEATPAISPGPLAFAAGLGLPLLLALGWLVLFLAHPRSWRSPWSFAAAWLVLAPLLLYAPLPFQVRLSHGLAVPVALTAAAALYQLLAPRGWPGWLRTVAGALALALAAATPLLLGAEAFWRAGHPPGAGFAPALEVRALDLLAALPRPPAGQPRAVLTAPGLGRWVPRFTGLPVVEGLPPANSGQLRRQDEVRRFFAGQMYLEEAGRFLDARGVAYLVYGPRERELDQAGIVPEALANLGWRELARVGQRPAEQVRLFMRGSPPPGPAS
ncbi:MAG: hypothetical protein KQJ78_08515 [Deltaproteobacteria bacterium]|nr:hypothetical protein [Deltaproteobacteria bacterium]